jgi:hypothetical protein
MEDRDIRAALDRHWATSDVNDFETEHQIYREEPTLACGGLIRQLWGPNRPAIPEIGVLLAEPD